MNILPKKRWHVRTKENIARVRRDEAEAAEKARIEQARIDKAESEARLNLLRNESRRKLNIDPSELLPDIKPESVKSTSTTSKHINFFEELEQGNIDYSKTNKDYEKEKKEEQEKYEKQIGLLTYLGQGIKEAVSKSWYNELPKRIKDDEKTVEIKPQKKTLEDPMQDIKKYLKIISLQRSDKSDGKEPKKIKSQDIKIKEEAKIFKHAVLDETGKKRKRKLSGESDSSKEAKRFKHADLIASGSKRSSKSSSETDSSEDDRKSHKKHKKHKKHKHKKHKKHKKSKSKDLEKGPAVDIQKLRAERLEREKEERLRTQELLAQTKGQNGTNNGGTQSGFRQKYNSQFFPQLARQNCEKTYR